MSNVDVVDENKIIDEIRLLQKKRRILIGKFDNIEEVKEYDDKIAHLIDLLEKGQTGLKIYELEKKIDILLSKYKSSSAISRIKIGLKRDYLNNEIRLLIQNFSEQSRRHHSSLRDEELGIQIEETKKVLRETNRELNSAETGGKNGLSRKINGYITKLYKRKLLLESRLVFLRGNIKPEQKKTK